MSIKIKNLESLKKIAKTVAENSHGKSVFLFSGPMGVGKTQFIRFFVEALGCDETMSPSFAIHNQYQTKSLSVDHIDLYRLESEEDLESTGFWDLFEQEGHCLMIEWADRLETSALPKDWQIFNFEFSFDIKDNTCRQLITNFPGI